MIPLPIKILTVILAFAVFAPAQVLNVESMTIEAFHKVARNAKTDEQALALADAV